MLANTKRVLMAAAFFGTVSLASAQTDKKETAVKAETAANAEKTKAETAVTTQLAVQTTPEIEGLKKQVAANPKDAEALSKLAVAYQNASDWNNSLQTWLQISTLLPEWAPAYYSHGIAYQNLKNNESAKAAYEKYVAMVKPEEVEANKKNLAYAHFFIAYALFETDKNAAKTHIAKSLQYDPSNTDAQNLSKSLNG